MEVLEKRPRDVFEYLKKLSEISRTVNELHSSAYHDIFVKIFRKYPEEAYTLIDKEKHIFYTFSRSRKTTKIFSKKFIDFLISDAASNRFNRFVVKKYLNEEQFEEFLCKLFPEKQYLNRKMIPHLNYTLDNYLNLYKSKQQQFNIFQKCFKKVYDEDLLENPKNITEELLKWIEDNDLRHNLANDKYENGIGTENKNITWIQYMKIDVSIPKLKELFPTANNADERSKLLQLALKSCIINKDFNEMLNFLKYFNTRHKNEQLPVRQGFINCLNLILNDEKIHLKLTDEIWDEIYYLLSNFEMKAELNYSLLSSIDNIFLGGLEYSSKKEKDLFQKWFSYFLQWAQDSYKFSYVLRDSGITKLFEYAAELIPEAKRDDMFNALTYFNKRNKLPNQTKINLIKYEWIIKKCDKKIKEVDEKSISSLESAIDFLKSDESIEKYYESTINKYGALIITLTEDYYRIPHVLKFMHLNPDFVPKIIGKLCESYMNMLKTENHYQFTTKVHHMEDIRKVPGLEKLIIEKSYEIIKRTNTDDMKQYALYFLIPYLKCDEFYEYAKPYYPTEKEAEMGSEGSQNKFQFQKQIVYGLRNFKSHPQCLIALRKFCVGDFLQLTVGTLNSVCQKLPLYKSKEFLQNNINSPVSFRKHVIRLLETLLNKSEIAQLFRNSWSSQKNASIRKIILEKLMKYLINEFDKDIWWKTIEKCVSDLNEKDTEIILFLTECNNIPKQYLSDYVELVWKKFAEINKNIPGDQVATARNNILRAVSNNINDINEKFIEYIINENLFNKNPKDYQESDLILTIAVQYVVPNLFNETKYLQRLEFIMKKLEEANTSNWNTYDDNTEQFLVRKNILSFLDKMLSSAMRTSLKNFSQDQQQNLISFIKKFVEYLQKIFDPEIYFHSYYMKCELSILYLDCDKQLFAFGKKLRNIIDREVQNYESIFIPQIAKEINEFLNILSHQLDITLCHVELFNGLMVEPLQSIECALIAYYLTNVHNLIIDKSQKRKCNENLLKTNDKRIKLYLNNFDDY